MLKYRIVSAIGLVALGLGIFWLDDRLDTARLTGFWRDLFPGRVTPTPGLPFLALVILVILPLAAWELCRIFNANRVQTHYGLIAVASVVTAATMYATPMRLDARTGITLIATVQIACFIAALVWHARHAKIEGAVAVAGATMFAVTYLGLFSGFFLAMRRSHSAWVVLAVVFVIKAADIGGYAAGKTLGRHKAYPWLSPGKTWEGLIGGVVFSAAFAVGFAYLARSFPGLTTTYHTVEGELVARTPTYDPLWAGLGGAVIALVAVVGGMALSLFKRDAGVKDAGSLLPGMGGVLDVLDTLLLVAPFAYWMLEFGAGE